MSLYLKCFPGYSTKTYSAKAKQKTKQFLSNLNTSLITHVEHNRKKCWQHFIFKSPFPKKFKKKNKRRPRTCHLGCVLEQISVQWPPWCLSSTCLPAYLPTSTQKNKIPSLQFLVFSISANKHGHNNNEGKQ